VHVGGIYSSDVFYDERPDLNEQMTRHGVLAVEMEAAELYTVAARHGARALAVLTISDHLLTGEALPSEDRQSSFSDMVEIALEAAFVRLKRDLAGRSVGAVGLGCMSFGGIYGATDEDESFACLAEALALGCRPLGRGRDLWRGRIRDGHRQVPVPDRADVSIATKAGIYQKPTRHFRNDEEALAPVAGGIAVAARS
jgi:hypothetical protein